MNATFDPFTDTYKDVERWLTTLVKRFRKKYRIDLDEARSLANLGFVIAYESYDLNEGSFTNWVYQKVWGNLLSGIRKDISENRRRKKTTTEFDLDSFRIPDPPDFRLDDLLTSLKKDAREVVTMALRPPKGVEKIVRHYKNDSEISYRMAIRQFLKDKGWTASRITETFNEVRRAL